METKIQLFSHPVRMRIIQLLLLKQEMTVGTIAEILSDVPPATLYRQIKKLQEAHAIKVVRENKIRGTVEKVFSLNIEKGQIKPMADIETKQEYFESFFSFLMMLLRDFQLTLDTEKPDLHEKGVSFRQTHLFLSNEELINLLGKMWEVVEEHFANKPTPERKLRVISVIALPKSEKQKKKLFN